MKLGSAHSAMMQIFWHCRANAYQKGCQVVCMAPWCQKVGAIMPNAWV